MQRLLFDLDNTLYPSTSGVTEALEAKMNAYVARLTNLTLPDAAKLRQGYFAQYGTTLRGLQLHHAVDTESYLAAVHDIPIHTLVSPDTALVRMLQQSRTANAVFTNSPAEHATRVLDAIGFGRDDLPVIDIRAIKFHPKPHIVAYEHALALLGWPSNDTVFFEDTVSNLRTAKTLGMRTVYIRHHEHESGVPEFVDDVFDDIRSAITAITAGR